MLSRFALVCLTILSAGAEEAPLPFVRLEPTAHLHAPGVDEASGIAVSPMHPDRLWIVNDSGCTADLYRTGTDGADHGRVAVKGVKNIDWEDLSSFVLDGKPYLLIADTGDNGSIRQQSQLH
ncbi:MAG TPA: hypothetical protein VGE67_13465, partial [Haloferula sp.]